jgi:hypothetical protein
VRTAQGNRRAFRAEIHRVDRSFARNLVLQYTSGCHSAATVALSASVECQRLMLDPLLLSQIKSRYCAVPAGRHYHRRRRVAEVDQISFGLHRRYQL